MKNNHHESNEEDDDFSLRSIDKNVPLQKEAISEDDKDLHLEHIEKKESQSGKGEQGNNLKNTDKTKETKVTNNMMLEEKHMRQINKKPGSEPIKAIVRIHKSVIMGSSRHAELGRIEKLNYFTYVIHSSFSCCFAIENRNSAVRVLTSKSTKEKYSFEYYLSLMKKFSSLENHLQKEAIQDEISHSNKLK
mmetsp:Transcript_34920/g.36338  ORF Transcript_34920/g.36338 Transcript_34920/m.36338 type:complete len:191 (+) Transcript_34920:1-573(+)